MSHDWEDCDGELAAAAICPMPDCGALAVAYHPTQSFGGQDAEPWEFKCPRCGIEFSVPEDELVVQSLPKGWPFGKVRAA